MTLRQSNVAAINQVVHLATTSLIFWAASWQNQQNDLCAQRRLRSAWAFAQSESLHCPHGETLGSWLPIERAAKSLIRLGGCPDSDQTGRVPRLTWVFAGPKGHFVGFVVKRLIYISLDDYFRPTSSYVDTPMMIIQPVLAVNDI